MTEEAVDTSTLPDTEGDPIADRLVELFQQLLLDLDENEHFPKARPLLAHYTSINVLELMLKGGEIWLANPLFMNDRQEVRFGILEGIEAFRNAKARLREVCQSQECFDAIVSWFDHYADKFLEQGALDVYVFCLSEHDPNDNDGRLSMWRGYGADGDGAAIVFNTSKVEKEDDSPLLLVKVQYKTESSQRDQLKSYVDQFISLVQQNVIPLSHCYVASWMLFRRLVYFSLMTKHDGFREEQEWRLAYVPLSEDESFLLDRVDYWIGPRGVEPKLKLPVAPLPRVLGKNVSFENFVEKIILGPTISSPLSHAMVSKMLKKLGKDVLIERVRASTIPFRSLRHR